MKINHNLIIFLVVAVGMFIIGGVLNGERVNRKYDRDRIKRIEANQERINYKIDSLYATAIQHEREILKQIDSTYLILDQLYDQKVLSQQRYNNYKKIIRRQKNNLDEKIEALNNLGRPFIFKKEQ